MAASSPKLILGINILVALFILLVLGLGMKESKLLIEGQNLTITGLVYGTTLSSSEIDSIRLVDSLPEIKRRSNGFAAFGVKKGYFKTQDGRKVKLMLNATKPPYIQITPKQGATIYFAAQIENDAHIMKNLDDVFETAR